ncbi:trafficking protein particle complex subunit 10-like [Salvelinus namaycush]|uniref:Trafficking protein particle complex subunit 10-like n=1 Tax=Salvelinus namaycush TaxID=8040 RepID=A0A8U1F6E4_SALNM|nr:trafficking protein particle complex subunit 10-like [Salvelinus namaycush]
MEPQEEKPIIYTMENKPIVTCAGDQALFTSLYTPLAQQLPREPMEWRRSYGRAPRTIHLEANFVQFKEELLPKEGNKALLTFPFLHIYWTDCCDIKVYKASVRDNMMRWQGNLRLHGSADWVIVVVETSDAKKKNKTNILPRSSLVDKIRNDFCNKQNDRCVVLSDPLKDSSRSQESWSAFLLKLRTLLLMSFTQNLGRFEEDMRTLREKRNQPGWSFCDYFMVQEELAFVFEMLQQCEDALVQYDELDALFTQYVLNFGAGDGANWLGSFCSPVKRWTGLLLRRPIDMEKRDGIQSGQASLLELRSYLFCRQCTLLIFLQRPWEVTQRALELLHNCVQELCLLEVSMLEGALDCWVFLSCLEVLHRIEGCCDQAQLEANVSHTVGLWAYATDKLKSLGYMCGLVSEKGPLSLELNRTVDLLAGLGDEKAETVHSLQSPYKKLKEALSSVEAFERHYLELSHAAVEMYRAIGRMRSAGLVGKSLAEFYMRKGDPEQAESFLQNALRSYVSEGWSLLVTHTRKQMAECQKLQGKTETYLQTSALLAGDANLTNEERIHFCQEILTFANQSTDSKAQKVTLSMSSFAQLKQLQFRPATATVHSGTALQVELCLRSLMPVAVPLEQLAASVHLNLEQGETNGKTRGPQRRPYPETVLFPLGNSSAMPPSAAGPSPELEEIQDCSPSDPRSLNSTGMVCKNTHLVMRRHDSSPSPDTPNLVSPVPVVMDDGANMLMSGDVTLLPGNNSIVFSVPSQELGTYTLRQLCATVGQVQFILPHISPLVHYEVYSQESQLTVEPLTDQLLAGLPQRAKVRLQTGHYTVKKGDALQLTNIDSMPILTSSSCPATILNSTAERVDESVLFIQSSDKVTCISLPPTPPYHTLEFQLEVLCVIPSDPVRPENQRLTNGEIRHRPRSYNLPDNHMTAINQRMSIDCPWSIYSTPISLTFYIPFKAKHSLLSAGNRKYIQVCLQNVSDVNFHLMDQRLTEKHRESSLELQSLNTKAQQLVYSKQSLYYVWDVRWKENMPLCLQCVFSASFSSASEEVSAFKPYHYAFQLERVTTLYSVRTEIMPAAGQQNCHSGSLCGLEMSITRLAEPEDDEDDRGTEKKGQTETEEVCSTKLMYKVADGSSSWVVYGRSSGLVSMPMDANANHRVQVELMPLFAGHLPFPDIEVFKYLPPSANSASQPDTDGCVENDTLSLLVRPLDDQGDTASIRSQGTVHSVGSGEQQSRVLPMPRLEPFSPGQVFNHSQGCQVLVLPSTDGHVLEINAT